MFRPKLKAAKKAIQGQQPTGVVGGGPVVAPQSQAQAPQQPQNMQMNAALGYKPPKPAPVAQGSLGAFSKVKNQMAGTTPPKPQPTTPPTGQGSLGAWDRMKGEMEGGAKPPPMPREDNRSNEEMINDLVREYLAGGPADTAEQEALVETQIRQQLERDLMDQRARAGAAGFEASGSLIGMDADARLMANQAATEQILGIRSDADKEAFERAMTAAGLGLDQRQQASDEMLRQMQMEALNNWLESQGAETVDEGGETAAEAILGDNTPDVLRDGGTDDPGEAYKFAMSTDELPPGSERVDGDSVSDQYRAPDGTMYTVPKQHRRKARLGSDGLIQA